MECDCGVYILEKDMAPQEKLIKSTKKFRTREKYKEMIVNEESNKEMKLLETSFNNALNLSNLIPCSSQVLCLPEKMAKFTSDLTELEIRNNDFPEISQLLSLVHNLQKLVINNNMLQSVPDGIGELHHLRILNLSHNQLTEVPDNLSHIKNLESLDLSNNQLKDLPHSFEKLQRLKELNISGNKFSVLPKCIANGMGTLKILNVSENDKMQLNIMPCSKYLERFYARENKNCCKFPDWILNQKFLNLKEVYLDNTQFDFYSFVISKGDLYHTSISMACSNLSSPVLEMMIEYMVTLEKLNVGNKDIHKTGNIFNNIPIKMLKNPQLIRELNFRATCLPMVPAAINQLSNLKVLDVSLNCIQWFPEELCELQNLERLIIDGNNLIMLPKNIGNLVLLQEIRAGHNALELIPDSFKKLKNLKVFDLYNNLIQEFPNVLFEMNNLEALDLEQNYFRTDNIKIGEITYSTLREAYESLHCSHDRPPGFKQKRKMSMDDDKIVDVEKYELYYSSEEEESKRSPTIMSNDSEENWDNVIDSDDEFEPESIKELSYHGKSKNYIPLKPLGFCPADLHSTQIKSEVASMRVYGSLPSFKIQQGQFDDA